MDRITFGFMDPDRSDRENGDLFRLTRSVAVRSFSGERVCDLSSFEADSIQESHEILNKDLGSKIRGLRDDFYRFGKRGPGGIKFPDIQSFFLFSFTAGVNAMSFILMTPEELQADMNEGRRQSSADEILSRQFPIHGPQWLVNALNREMPSVEDVFCDFQDEVLKPMGLKQPPDPRALADAMACAFLWAHLAGTYWMKEAVTEIGLGLKAPGIQPESPEGALYQVKKSIQMIDARHVEQVLKAGSILAE